jgi:hypothetical protein
MSDPTSKRTGSRSRGGHRLHAKPVTPQLSTDGESSDTEPDHYGSDRSVASVQPPQNLDLGSADYTDVGLTTPPNLPVMGEPVDQLRRSHLQERVQARVRPCSV